MINLLKKIELPHIASYRWKWVRRVMIAITIPQEIARAIYGVFTMAKLWWSWDGTVTPEGLPLFPVSKP